MNYTFKRIEENDFKDYALDIYDRASFTQSKLYSLWQKGLNRRVLRYLVLKGETIVSFFQIIEYPLVFGKKYLYIPYGPLVSEINSDFLKQLKEKLKQIAKEKNAVFVRLDFDPNKSINEAGYKKAFYSTYHSSFFQPRAEWYFDILDSEEKMLAGMEKDTRYSVRTSLKRGAENMIITKDFLKYFDSFFTLMQETAKRNGFSLHSKDYYKEIFETLNGKDAFLSVVIFEEEILVVDLFLVFGNTAHYVFGSSSDKHRKLLPSYHAIWKAILYSKEIGLKNFNFGGVENVKDRFTGWKQLSEFKRNWGGREVLHSDFYDIVCKPLWYYLYCLRKFLKSFR